MMTDSHRTHDIDYGATSQNSGNGTASSAPMRADRKVADTGRTVLVGILGGIASALGYAVYQRLPEDQKDKLQAQARGFISVRLSELRSSFNI